jgi:4-hydroxy-4-methyl-2-oxoglutarate aldolase
VRDVAELVELGLPIWTRFIRVKGATKAKVGELNGVVTIGRANISTGDIVILDSDGGIYVKRERASEVLNASEARLAKEAILRNKLLAGQTSYDLHGLRPFVERGEK